jgi:hypothetical protein
MSNRHQSNLEAVKKTLTDDYEKAFANDVAWRSRLSPGANEGCCVRHAAKYIVWRHEEDWVTPAVARLSEKN